MALAVAHPQHYGEFVPHLPRATLLVAAFLVACAAPEEKPLGGPDPDPDLPTRPGQYYVLSSFPDDEGGEGSFVMRFHFSVHELFDGNSPRVPHANTAWRVTRGQMEHIVVQADAAAEGYAVWTLPAPLIQHDTIYACAVDSEHDCPPEQVLLIIGPADIRRLLEGRTH